MLQNKEGKDVSLDYVLNFLTGTNELDEAKSVMDFAVYPIIDSEHTGNPEYYLVASEAIVTQISFIGPFVMVELDFRNIGVNILENVMSVINKFHHDVNAEKKLFISTITSIEEESTHIMSLINPLICVRGYSKEGDGTTIMQMIYSADNVGFSLNEIDYTAIEADIEREIRELESMAISDEIMAAAMEMEEDENNEAMKEMFKPEFGFRTPESKLKDNMNDVRVSGSKGSARVSSRNNEKIQSSDDTRTHSIKESDND